MRSRPVSELQKTSRGNEARVSLKKVTAAQIAGTIRALSKLIVTPAEDKKSPHSIMCKKISADTGAFGFLRELTLFFKVVEKTHDMVSLTFRNVN